MSNLYFIFISVFSIKEELDDTTIDLKIEPSMNSFLFKEDVVYEAVIVKVENPSIGNNYCADELIIKTEPQQEDLVSKEAEKPILLQACEQMTPPFQNKQENFDSRRFPVQECENILMQDLHKNSHVVNHCQHNFMECDYDASQSSSLKLHKNTVGMKKMTEWVVLDKLFPENITEGFCALHGISSHSADHCKEQLQLWCNRHAGEILSPSNLLFLISFIYWITFYFLFYFVVYFIYS